MDIRLVQIALLAMAILVLAQGLIVFLIFTNLAKQIAALRPRLTALLVQTNAASTSLRQLVSHTEGLYERLSRLESRAPEYKRRVQEWIVQTDVRVQESISAARSAVRRLDATADSVLIGFSRQTYRVHKAVVHPALRLSEILKSGADLVGRWLGHERSPASYSSDQEIFI